MGADGLSKSEIEQAYSFLPFDIPCPPVHV
jgi:hypothetical protein